MTIPSFCEPIIEPTLPIIDPHHHLWWIASDKIEAAAAQGEPWPAEHAIWRTVKSTARYLWDELLSDLNCGQNIRATVFVDSHAMYRAQGPDELRSLGEVEFANGIASMGASGLAGALRPVAGIVGNADLLLGEQVESILEAHLRVAGPRYKGVRNNTASAPDSGTLLPYAPVRGGILGESSFRAGTKVLGRLGLSLDLFVIEPQLAEVTQLARASQATKIILNHMGGPVGIGRYAGQREARFPLWRENMLTLSGCPNVLVKLGGAAPVIGFPSYGQYPCADSRQIASELKPYVETCIEFFGADRCMFESDFPPTAVSCSYAVLWNAFKRLTAGSSAEEKRLLFYETARNTYRLECE